MTTTRPRESSSCTRYGPHLDDARVYVPIVGDDAGLAAGEADGVAAQFADRHREDGHRDPLAGGEQHVELTSIGVGRDLPRERQQLVGRIAHRGYDDRDVVAGSLRPHDAVGDLADARNVGNAAAAVLLDDDRHGAGDDSATSTHHSQLPTSKLRPAFALGVGRLVVGS